MQEKHPAPGEQEVFYIYDRVCKKEIKTRQILQEYGTCAAYRPDVPPDMRPDSPGTERPFGREFAESQRKRAEEYFRANPERTRTSRSSEGQTYTDGAGNEYIYRPGPVSGGGAAVRQRPLKLIMEQIVNMLETIDARRQRDEEAAKRQAIARKKFTENRHALITAALLLLVTVLFTLFVYFAFFVISDVEVEGSEIYTSEQVVSAAGFEMGDNLYSFHAGHAEELILFYCPQLKSAQILRTAPNSVDILVADDTAAYYAEIYGETALLSAGLRVLEFTDTVPDGLTELVLPAVKDSVAGRVVTFAEERNLRYVRSVLTAAEGSSLYREGRLGRIDVSDEHNVTITCDGMYILRLGSEKETDLKLRMAYKTIGSEAFDREIPASINLTKVGEASVRYDMRIVVD